MRRILIGITGFFVLLIAGAALLPFFIDVNRYKPEILAKAKEVLGHDLIIEGRLGLHLLPNPAFFADKIRVVNAPDGSRPYLASLEKLKLQIALLPLFRKKIQINNVDLAGLDIFLERLPGDRGNWESAVPREKKTFV